MKVRIANRFFPTCSRPKTMINFYTRAACSWIHSTLNKVCWAVIWTWARFDRKFFKKTNRRIDITTEKLFQPGEIAINESYKFQIWMQWDQTCKLVFFHSFIFSIIHLNFNINLSDYSVDIFSWLNDNSKSNNTFKPLVFLIIQSIDKNIFQRKTNFLQFKY